MRTARLTYRQRACLLAAMACAALMTLVGCRRLEMDVRVDRDGGGQRDLTMIVESRQEEPGAPTEAEARELLGVTVARGWREGITEETGPDGKARRRPTYRREMKVDRLADWQAASGDLRMLGAAAGKPLSDVQFRNQVEVEMGRGATGSTYTYRETFTWNRLLEALVDVVADRFRAEMAGAYPFLGPTELAELRGLAAGAFTVGMRLGGAGDDKTDMDEELVIETLSARSWEIVARLQPTVESDRLRDLIGAIVRDENDIVGGFITEELPGVEIAGQTGITLRLTLPGRIVETNGKLEQDGSVAWEFGIGDALPRPRVCWAKSELAP